MSAREPSAAKNLQWLLSFPPHPSDGPDYHADLAAWKARVRALGATEDQIRKVTNGD